MNKNANTQKMASKINKSFLRSKFAVFILGMFSFTVLSGYYIYKEKYVFSKWIPVEATVIQLKTADTESNPYYYYTLQYSVHGETYTSQKDGSGTPRFSESDLVPIKINPQNYNQNRFNFKDGINHLYAMFAICLILTIGFSYIYFTENKRLQTKQIKPSEKATIPRLLIATLLPLALLFAPLAKHSVFEFLQSYTLASFIYALSAIIFHKLAWRREIFRPRYFFYAGLFIGIFGGILLFACTSVLVFLGIISVSENLIRAIVIISLTGWYFTPILMLAFWAITISKKASSKLLVSTAFIMFALIPAWYDFYKFLLPSQNP